MQALQESNQNTESAEYLQNKLYEIGLEREHLEKLLKAVNLEEKDIIEMRDSALEKELLESGRNPIEKDINHTVDGLLDACITEAMMKQKGILVQSQTAMSPLVIKSLKECYKNNINPDFVNSVLFIFGLAGSLIDLENIKNLDHNKPEDREIIEELIGFLNIDTYFAIDVCRKMNLSKEEKIFLENRIRITEQTMEDFKKPKKTYLEAVENNKKIISERYIQMEQDAIRESDKKSTVVPIGDDVNIPKLRIVNEFNEAEELKKLEGVERRIEELEEEDNNLIKSTYYEDYDGEEWEEEYDGLNPEVRAKSDEINMEIDALTKEKYRIANYILEETGKDPLEYENNLKINGLITSYLHYILAKKRMAKYNEDTLGANDDIYKRLQETIDEHLNECGHINQKFINSIQFIFGLSNKEIDLYTVRDLKVNNAKDRKVIEILIHLLGDKTKEAIKFINTKSKIKSLMPSELIIRISQIERAMKDFEQIKQAYLNKEKGVSDVMDVSPEEKVLAKELAMPGRASEISKELEGEAEPNIIQKKHDDIAGRM